MEAKMILSPEREMDALKTSGLYTFGMWTIEYKTPVSQMDYALCAEMFEEFASFFPWMVPVRGGAQYLETVWEVQENGATLFQFIATGTSQEPLVLDISSFGFRYALQGSETLFPLGNEAGRAYMAWDDDCSKVIFNIVIATDIFYCSDRMFQTPDAPSPPDLAPNREVLRQCFMALEQSKNYEIVEWESDYYPHHIEKFGFR